MTYTFIVEAGNDPNDGPRFHPFYITNSIDGGILLDTTEQRLVRILSNQLASTSNKQLTDNETYSLHRYIHLLYTSACMQQCK